MQRLTACAAGTQSIGEATHLIRRGEADLMLTGGTHTMLHELGVTGFNRLTALSTANEDPPAASRPFSRTRGGFVMGEGSAIVILESAEHAAARGATPLAEIAGYGSTADAYEAASSAANQAGAKGRGRRRIIRRRAREDRVLGRPAVGR